MPNVASSDPSASATPDRGKILAEWSFPDVAPQPRSRRWYVSAGALGALMAVYGVWTGNFLFPILLCLFALTFALVRRERRNTRCLVAEDGIALGQAFYPYRELKDFWILYQPPEVKTLYLEFRHPLKPRLPIPLVDQNPVTIRHLLLDYLDENLDREEEPALDQISRMLKL